MREAALIFTDENLHWAGSLLRPGFRHVFAIRPEPDGTSMIFDFTLEGLGVKHISTDCRALAALHHVEGHRALLIRHQPTPPRVQFPMLWHNCVGLSRLALGITTPAVLPYGLWTALKEDALCVFD